MDEMREDYDFRRQRRRRRRKKPTWQRLLRKYWPPIRFGLIILAAVLLLWLIFGAIANALTPDEPIDPAQTTPPPTTTGSTEPDGTTAPEETTTPTEPDVTEPPTEPDPFAGAVEESWYDDALFIGNFRTIGLRDYARSGNADYFCTINMSVFNYSDASASDNDFSSQTLESLLGTETYGKIIITLGINECGYPASSLVNAFSEMIDTIRSLAPDAKIILQAILPVSEDYAADREHFSPSHLDGLNEQIAGLADGSNVYFIDVTEHFVASDGYLSTNVSNDGCTLRGSEYTNWANWIGVALADLGIE